MLGIYTNNKNEKDPRPEHPLANSKSSDSEMLSRDWSLSSLLHTFPASRQFIRYLDWLLQQGDF